MKRFIWLFAALFAAVALTVFVTSCEEDDGNDKGNGTVGIPSALVSEWASKASPTSVLFKIASDGTFTAAGKSDSLGKITISDDTVELKNDNGATVGTFKYSISNDEMSMTNPTGSALLFSLNSPFVKIDDSFVVSGFTISSPYADVNWETFEQYKAAMHVHTNNSDGGRSLSDVVDEHYRLGYDILGITDHVWKRVNNVEIYRDLITRTWTQTEWKTYAVTHISQDRLDEIQSGDAVVVNGVERNGRGMLMIPNTAELALNPGENELNVFFTYDGDPPQAWALGLEAGIQRAHNNANSIFFINHPGRATGGSIGGGAGENASNHPSHINRYSSMFLQYPNCVGFEIFNRRDEDSRSDRILWDNVLKVTVPQGRFVWGYGNDDSHSHGQIDVNYNVFIMPGNSLETTKNAMLKGHSYAVTRIARREGVDVPNSSPNLRPVINSISVNNEANSITINAENTTTVVWISEGREILTTTGASSTINLMAEGVANQVGSYVRANIIGNGGMAVIQPIGTTKK